MNRAGNHIRGSAIFGVYIFLTWMVFILPYSGLRAQQASEYEVKAAFLYNFSKFLEWPPGTFDNYTGPFVVGVYGRNPFGNFLAETISGEVAMGRPIRLQYFNNLNEIGTCHILFIERNAGTEEALKALEGKPILTVSEDPDFCRKGGIVRFFSESDMIRIEINPEAAKSANLTISSKLLRIAKIYESTK